MRIAADTNIISALWSQEPTASKIAGSLAEVRSEGRLVIVAPVYAELLAYPHATASFVNEFLADTGIIIDFELQPQVWFEAGQRFASYANRRRQFGGEGPKRLLADFIIEAQAMLPADLMALDPTRYRQGFPELKRI